MDEQKYAISQYPDVESIYKRLDALIKQPLRPVKREKMQAVLTYFNEKCVRSKQLTDEAKKIIPGGVQHNLALIIRFQLL